MPIWRKNVDMSSVEKSCRFPSFGISISCSGMNFCFAANIKQKTLFYARSTAYPNPPNSGTVRINNLIKTVTQTRILRGLQSKSGSIRWNISICSELHSIYSNHPSPLHSISSHGSGQIRPWPIQNQIKQYMERKCA